MQTSGNERSALLIRLINGFRNTPLWSLIEANALDHEGNLKAITGEMADSRLGLLNKTVQIATDKYGFTPQLDPNNPHFINLVYAADSAKDLAAVRQANFALPDPDRHFILNRHMVWRMIKMEREQSGISSLLNPNHFTEFGRWASGTQSVHPLSPLRLSNGQRKSIDLRELSSVKTASFAMPEIIQWLYPSRALNRNQIERIAQAIATTQEHLPWLSEEWQREFGYRKPDLGHQEDRMI